MTECTSRELFGKDFYLTTRQIYVAGKDGNARVRDDRIGPHEKSCNNPLTALARIIGNVADLLDKAISRSVVSAVARPSFLMSAVQNVLNAQVAVCRRRRSKSVKDKRVRIRIQ